MKKTCNCPRCKPSRQMLRDDNMNRILDDMQADRGKHKLTPESWRWTPGHGPGGYGDCDGPRGTEPIVNMNAESPGALADRGQEACSVDAAPSIGWQPISTAPTDGTFVWVWAAPREGLPGFVEYARHHEDAGWCVDELREVTLWQPAQEPPAQPTTAPLDLDAAPPVFIPALSQEQIEYFRKLKDAHLDYDPKMTIGGPPADAPLDLDAAPSMSVHGHMIGQPAPVVMQAVPSVPLDLDANRAAYRRSGPEHSGNRMIDELREARAKVSELAIKLGEAREVARQRTAYHAGEYFAAVNNERWRFSDALDEARAEIATARDKLAARTGECDAKARIIDQLERQIARLQAPPGAPALDRVKAAMPCSGVGRACADPNYMCTCKLAARAIEQAEREAHAAAIEDAGHAYDRLWNERAKTPPDGGFNDGLVAGMTELINAIRALTEPQPEKPTMARSANSDHPNEDRWIAEGP